MPKDYTFIEAIGEGATGVVVKAHHIPTDRDVAIKFLKPDLFVDDQARERMRREARLLATLDHANILKVLSANMDGNAPYIVMEYVSGMSLARHLEQSGCLPVERFSRLFEQILRGLAHAHAAGVVHRDLKPSNIMLSSQELDQVKIVDFGLAKLSLAGTEQDLTATGVLIGSHLYMSPEQCTGQSACPQSDIYAIGCIAYQCLSGSAPFAAETSLELMYKKLHCDPPPVNEVASQQLPTFLSDLIADCVARSVDGRPRDAATILQLLSTHENTISRMTSTIPKTTRKEFRPAVVAATVLLTVLLLSVSIPPFLSHRQGASVTHTIAKKDSPKPLSLGETPIETLKRAFKLTHPPYGTSLTADYIKDSLANIDRSIAMVGKVLSSNKFREGNDPLAAQAYLVQAVNYFNRAGFTRSPDDLREAERLCDRALGFAGGENSRWRPAEAMLRTKAEILCQQKRYTDALSILRKALVLNQKEPAMDFVVDRGLPASQDTASDPLCVKALIASCLIAMNRSSEATTLLETSLKEYLPEHGIDSRSLRAVNLLCEVYGNDNKSRELISMVEKAIPDLRRESYYESCQALLSLFFIELKLGKPANAEHYLQQAVDDLLHVQETKKRVARLAVRTSIQNLKDLGPPNQRYRYDRMVLKYNSLIPDEPIVINSSASCK